MRVIENLLKQYTDKFLFKYIQNNFYTKIALIKNKTTTIIFLLVFFLIKKFIKISIYRIFLIYILIAVKQIIYF